MEKPLDRVDCEIISLLQEDGRISNIEIAKQINVSEGTVRSRLNRLIKNEIIQIVAVSNPIKLGFTLVGHLRISAEPTHIEQVAAQLREIDQLWFIVATTGGHTGIDAEFIAKDLDEFNALILSRINRIQGVTRVETTLTLDFLKRRYDWGTAGPA
ncbi:Lrp/AsnC family transcriptional regulator [Desulfogranum mediterraneum]|uniref:Lrp/AsnC family transcriptional regulator n=1 Tax=Desulfogranum mediterraneum TaxID=160661 RepID=UPI00137895EF|nr:winged helix-turn-helix transcriptional regulator [Desulfogranum mediterraneum]